MVDNQQAGVFVAVVGPSGAGKDSVLGFVRERLGSDPRFYFVRRAITRPAMPDSEDHDSMTEAAFAAAEAAGRFLLHWQAHGLSYGIPISAAEALGRGAVVVANLSRRVLPELAARRGRTVIVEVSANPEVLRERLRRRGRETQAEIEARIRRASEARIDPAIQADVVRIDNSGPLERAGTALADLLLALALR